MRRSIAVAILFSVLSAGLAQQGAPVVPAVAVKPAAEPPGPDIAKFSPQERGAYVGAKSAMEWLARLNQPDGRFLPGIQPALRTPLESDSYLHQAAAAWALGQASAYFGDERAAAVAKQAVLTLLLETTVDPQTNGRFTVAPEPMLNRLASGGLLALAIHALPRPANDLVHQAEQLLHHLRLQQQADGSFKLDADGIQHASGWALHAIVRSHSHRPEAWKLDALRKAAAHYHAWWREHKNVPMIATHTAAYAEAYQHAKDTAFATAIFDMNDWLCTLQYANRDARRPHWTGGMQPWVDGKPSPTAPDIRSADAARSLACACRVAHQAGDAARLQRYRAALAACVEFVGTLQYTEANTQHFADWYRQKLLIGAFYASHQDGNLRLDATAHAVAALMAYLQTAP